MWRDGIVLCGDPQPGQVQVWPWTEYMLTWPEVCSSCGATCARLADVVRQDADFMQVGEQYRDDPAFDVQKLVDELVGAESVPLLPVLRYKDAGLRKRAEWERTWEL